MAEELAAHDANEELDGTTTDSPVVTGSGFNSSGTYITYRVIISSGLSDPSSPTSLPPWVLCMMMLMLLCLPMILCMMIM